MGSQLRAWATADTETDRRQFRGYDSGMSVEARDRSDLTRRRTVRGQCDSSDVRLLAERPNHIVLGAPDRYQFRQLDVLLATNACHPTRPTATTKPSRKQKSGSSSKIEGLAAISSQRAMSLAGTLCFAAIWDM